MSNNYGRNIWHLDTGSSTAILASGSKIKLRKLVWYPNAADTDIDVQDANGESILKTRANVPAGSNREDVGKIERDFGDGQWFDGFTLAVIDGGILDVYHA